MHNEELRAGRVRMHCACHGKYARRMLQVIFEAVVCKLTADRISRAAHAGSVRAAALDHKAADDSVEDQSVIEALFNKADKVVDRVRGDLRIKLCLHNISVFHCNCNDRILCHFLNPHFLILKYCNCSEFS